MRRIFLSALLVLSLVLAGSDTAAAQSANQTATPTETANTTDNQLDKAAGAAADVLTRAQQTKTPSPQPTPEPDDSDSGDERIDSQTYIVSSEYRANESVAVLTLRSEAVQTVTLSDAGAFREGGVIASRVIVLEEGETATIELPVTQRNGYVGISISTEQTPVYAEIIQRQTGGLDILRALGSLQAWFAGISIAFIWMAIAGWSVMRGEESRPEVA